jgi:iron(III) transport system substrate-binding protein
MTRGKRATLTGAGIILVLAAIAAAIWPAWFTGKQNAIVVYCAHDSIYADGILKDFEQKTGIPITVLYDSEATKSLGLVNQLKFEKDDPHCDVFWNNELLGTMDLANESVLEPYKGTGYERIPKQYKDDEGRWTGFGARMRVWIVNKNETPRGGTPAVERFHGNVNRAAIANPLYGTTLTHFSILWHVWGQSQLKSWYADIRKRGIRILAGNARVKDAVADGVCDFGWTDTDDCFEAIDDKKPVTMEPILVNEPRKVAAPALPYTIVIPNTVSLIRGSHHRKEAERLIDFLLSAETELTLAKSKSRQVPLGPVDKTQLPTDVSRLAAYVSQGYDLRKLEKARRECLAWLKTEPQ